MKSGIWFVNPTLIAEAVARAYGSVLPTYYVITERGRVVRSGRNYGRLQVKR